MKWHQKHFKGSIYPKLVPFCWHQLHFHCCPPKNPRCFPRNICLWDGSRRRWLRCLHFDSDLWEVRNLKLSLARKLRFNNTLQFQSVTVWNLYIDHIYMNLTSSIPHFIAVSLRPAFLNNTYTDLAWSNVNWREFHLHVTCIPITLDWFCITCAIALATWKRAGYLIPRAMYIATFLY